MNRKHKSKEKNDHKVFCYDSSKNKSYLTLAFKHQILGRNLFCLVHYKNAK